VSCKIRSTAALESTILVTPPKVNNQIKSLPHKKGTEQKTLKLIIFVHQVRTFTLVGIPIIMVAALKYNFESVSILTLYIWCAHTTKPKKPIERMDQTIPKNPINSPLIWNSTI